jgi:putative transposon-encoded protein
MLNTIKNVKYTGLIISLFMFVSVVLLDQNMFVNKVSAQKAETQKLPNLTRDKTLGYFPQNGSIDLLNNIFDKSAQNQMTQPANENQPVGLDNNQSGNGLDYKAAKNINGTVRSKFDFDGDGKTDISIFRPSLGEWWILKSSDGGNITVQLGDSSDLLVPADYIGNGKTQIAKINPQVGVLCVLIDLLERLLLLLNELLRLLLLAQAGIIPAPLDYDGDGKDDLGFFNPSNSTWVIERSSDNQIITTQFGLPTDKPVPADYDGDGKADIAIYRPSNGQWWIKGSSNQTIQVTQFGLSTDRPVQADYTGDGKADLAVWRPQTGEWFVLRSENNSFYSFPFGSTGDIPVPGDYDGDGRNDAAVFRPSTNVWYLNRSTGGVQITQFGASGDIPIPSVYVP